MASYIPPSTAAPSTPIRGSSSTRRKASPRTPSSTTSTPYTTSPSSGRSFASSDPTSPSSVKYSPGSPLHAKSTKSIADLTENWRERAQLNGIKVSTAESDEMTRKGGRVHSRLRYALPSLTPHPNGANICLALLPPLGFTANFRRPVKSTPFSSPVSSSRRSNSTFNTPSPKPNIYRALGSLTAPPEPRRRTVYDSPFSDISEHDETIAPPSSDFSSLKAFRDLSCLEKPLPIVREVTQPSSSCSVCDKEPSGSSRMIVLSPCSHVFCASCFTGTLNIVGEKNMSCMECHSPVESFHFALGPGNAPSSDAISETVALLGMPFVKPPLPAYPKTSKLRSQRDGITVLRIDNVPWDVTPLVIKNFIKQPIIQAHVLLDINGKTLSHAFIQLSLDNARATLRSSQNAILGKGRRARAVTVTLSSQEELMAALYPHWRGSFDGCEPSLDGLDNEQVNEALQNGLISQTELNSLLTLVTTPDSHFLKVPSLPFYSLISILSTFPSDVDSRVFWSGQLRDALFRVTHAAFKVLVERKQESDEDFDLWKTLVVAGVNCRAFTEFQVQQLQLIVKTATSGPETPFDNRTLPLHVKAIADQYGLDPNTLAALLQSSCSFA